VTGDEWRDARQEMDAVEAEIGRIRDELAELDRRRARAERIRRVLPSLRDLASLDAEAQGLAGTPDLPPDAGERFAASTGRRERAASDRDRAATAAAALATELAASNWSPWITRSRRPSAVVWIASSTTVMPPNLRPI